MTAARIRVGVEVTPKKAFASALDWPGWSRSGKTPEAAVEALLASADRYRPIADATGADFPGGSLEADVVQTLDGDATTAFGAPSITFELDRRATTAGEAARLAAIMEAAWAGFDRTAKAAPVELRKGPRGGGRDTPKIVEHVLGAEQAYGRSIGLRLAAPDPANADAVAAARREIAALIREPTDGKPIARWTQRYAARRIAWHVVDHAWEIEDRS